MSTTFYPYKPMVQELQFQKVLITPAIAKQYLEANIANRRIKEPMVLRYANDMRNGKWKENTAEVISISKSGIILNGQHRLHAIIKANVSIFFHVAFNLEDNVFDVLDTGTVRNATDTFKIKNIKQENVLPSIISMYNLLVLGKKAGVQNNHKSTNSALLEQYYLDENFWQNIAKQSHLWYLAYAKVLPPSFLGGFYAYFLKLNENKAEDFMTQLATGIGIKNNSVGLLRNKLMQDRMSPRKMPATLKMALIIKGWNLFIKNETVKILKFDTVKEEFPIALKQYS
jgi:hypothetical protein